MDTTLLLALLAVVAVGFFAYQWWSRRARVAKPAKAAAPAAVPAAAAIAAPLNQPPAEEKLPQVPAQTADELRAKEPIQRPVVPTQQVPVMNNGTGPADFGDSLRRPEETYYQPTADAAGPALRVSDVPSGRAAVQSTPLSGNQQAFSPEMAQNGGAMVGNSVFAYDGMEPTEFSAF
jgi:hypothetical protein